jgi:hypothetical protein
MMHLLYEFLFPFSRSINHRQVSIALNSSQQRLPADIAISYHGHASGSRDKYIPLPLLKCVVDVSPPKISEFTAVRLYHHLPHFPVGDEEFSSALGS